LNIGMTLISTRTAVIIRIIKVDSALMDGFTRLLIGSINGTALQSILYTLNNQKTQLAITPFHLVYYTINTEHIQCVYPVSKEIRATYGTSYYGKKK